MEAFIQNNSSVTTENGNSGGVGSQTNQNETTTQINNPTNLPESPPDSGSEPPYSPNVKNLQLEHMSHSTLNTLTELHVPHHHNLMTPSSELYMSSEQHSQFGNLMHPPNKHESQLLHHQQPAPPTATSQDHMMLYQVNQSGQIIELNHIHHQNQQQQQINGRLLEMDAPTSIPQIHEIHPTTLGDNLQIMAENFTQIGNHSGGAGVVGKKRRSFVSLDGDVKVKGYGKSSTETTSKCITQNILSKTMSWEKFSLQKR